MELDDMELGGSRISEDAEPGESEACASVAACWMSPRLAFKLYWCGSLLQAAMARHPERYMKRLPAIARPHAESSTWWACFIACVRHVVEAVGDGRYPEPTCTGELYALYFLLDVTRDVEERGQDGAMRAEMAHLPAHHMDSDYESAKDLALGEYDLHVLLSPDMAARLTPLGPEGLALHARGRGHRQHSGGSGLDASTSLLSAATSELLGSAAAVSGFASAAQHASCEGGWQGKSSDNCSRGAASQGQLITLSPTASMGIPVPSTPGAPCADNAMQPGSPAPGGAGVQVGALRGSPSSASMGTAGSRSRSRKESSSSGASSTSSLFGALLHTLHIPPRKSYGGGALAAAPDRAATPPTTSTTTSRSGATAADTLLASSPILGGMVAAARALIHPHSPPPRQGSLPAALPPVAPPRQKQQQQHSVPQSPLKANRSMGGAQSEGRRSRRVRVPRSHASFLHPADWYWSWADGSAVQL